jgi:hypothetical protein
MALSRGWVDNLNRLGLLFGFLSFWFAAPEFLGEERLRSWEQSLVSGLGKLKFAMLYGFLALSGIAFVVLGINAVRENGSVAVSVWVAGGLFLTMILVVILFSAMERIVSRLAHDSEVRQTSLFVGAMLFTASFVLQLIATF